MSISAVWGSSVLQPGGTSAVWGSSWFPFPVQICLNGREWLAREMDAAGLEYARQDNCFPWIAAWAQAQRLMDNQLKAHWPQVLDSIGQQLNPIHGEIFHQHP